MLEIKEHLTCISYMYIIPHILSFIHLSFKIFNEVKIIMSLRIYAVSRHVSNIYFTALCSWLVSDAHQSDIIRINLPLLVF